MAAVRVNVAQQGLQLLLSPGSAAASSVNRCRCMSQRWTCALDRDTVFSWRGTMREWLQHVVLD